MNQTTQKVCFHLWCLNCSGGKLILFKVDKSLSLREDTAAC